MKNKSTPLSVLIGLLIALAFAVSSSPARADSTEWTGAVSDDWFAGPSPSPSPGSPGNWTNGVPNACNDAFINNGGKAEIGSSTPLARARSLTLGEDAPGGGAPQSGTLVIDGTNVGALLLGFGSCEVPEGSGVIYVGKEGTGTLEIIDGGELVGRDGYIALAEGSNGTVTVTGPPPAFDVPNWRVIGRLFIGASPSSNSGGTAILNVTDGGSVKVENDDPNETGMKVGTSGTVTGDGYIFMPLLEFNSNPKAEVRGTLAPTGTLTIESNLHLINDEDGEATTLFSVTPTAQDKIVVSEAGAGTAILAGRLIVTLSGTFYPGLDCTTTFTLLHASGGRGTPATQFDSVSILGIPTLNPPYTAAITYDGNDVNLVLTFNNCDPE